MIARRFAPSIAIQILVLMVGGLIVAQFVTLALTLLLPPPPPVRHDLTDIARALQGAEIDTRGARPMVRTVETEPPSLRSPGWMVSERSRAELAALLGVRESDVRIVFYAPLPFAGASGPPALPPQAPRAELEPDNPLFVKAVYQPPGGAPPGGGIPGGMPGGGMPGMPPGGFPGGAFPGGPMGGRIPPSMPTPRGAASRPQIPPPTAPSTPAAGGSPTPPTAPIEGVSRGAAPPVQTAPAGVIPGGGASQTPLSAATERPTSPPNPAAIEPGQMGGGFGAGRPPPLSQPMEILPPAQIYAPSRPVAQTPAQPAARSLPGAAAPIQNAPQTPARILPATPAAPAQALTQAPSFDATAAASDAAAIEQDQAGAQDGRTLAAPVSRGLFGLAPAPMVEGDFVAALRTQPGRWITVQPKPESFPNTWQKRVLLWFAIAFAVVGPLGYLFARRLARPLADFARAAEQLGRDPSSSVMVSDGPAEVGRAARAFNTMQDRLRRYIDDRTAMISAISHDLRTPLARMRFRLERAPPSMRAAMDRDLSQMDAMISSVLVFMRDSAEGAPRQRVDLLSVLETVVDDAVSAAGDVELETGQPAEVVVDVLGVQRVFENLIDNALKYGRRARVRLFTEGGDVVVEIADEGPGLPDSELDRVFLPFYRAQDAERSAAKGMGLGLAVARSALRAHGGDVVLRSSPTGLTAQVRLPLASGAAPQQSARTAA